LSLDCTQSHKKLLAKNILGYVGNFI